MFLSVTERDYESYRISVNGSGAGVDDVAICSSYYLGYIRNNKCRKSKRSASSQEWQFSVHSS